jgi:uncharacterized protein (TIGR02117 family)
MKFKSTIQKFAALAFIATQAGCANVPNRISLPVENTPYTIYLMQYDWHTALQFDGPSILAHSKKLNRDFHDHKYLTIGWGDGDYFVDAAPPWTKAVKALVASDYPALQVVATDGESPFKKPATASIPLAITEKGYRELADYIDRSIVADAEGQPTYLGVQQPNFNLYYKATGQYSLFNTCNSWIGGALQAAGLPIGGMNLTASDIVNQASRISKQQGELQH